MKCFNCGLENDADAIFCNSCGGPFSITCSQCGKANKPGSKFCNRCGESIKPQKGSPPLDFTQPQSYTPKFLADKILTNRSSIEGERKIVTVLFADVVNYTALAETIDAEEVHQVMDGCFKILMHQIHDFEGTINQFTGDGVMALFGAPVAHEDHAQRACHAALKIQKALGEYGKKVNGSHAVEFQMRIGLNSGPVVVGKIGDDLRMDYTALGDTTNLAARVQQSAKPGEVWISQETRNLIKGYFEEEPAGETDLKGKAKPQKLYKLIGERPEVRTRFEAGLSRGMTELVGRRPEMEALRAAFRRASEGDAQVVDVVGEPGVGKSRLIYEFRKTLGEEARFLSGICVQYGRSMSFLPMRDVVKEAFGIREGTVEEEALRRIAGIATGELVAFIPFYRNLLALPVDDPKFSSLSPEGRKFGTFEAVKSLLLNLSQKEALVVFLEDVHWIDKISEEFFAYFSRCIPSSRVMILTAYRPEAAPPWAQGAHYQKLSLETLSANFAVRLVRNILGGVSLEPELENKISKKSGGNPFFLEEIVRELLDRKDLIKMGDRYTCTRPIEQCEIPGTIQGVLASRMDRLSEDLKRTTQIASVIGRDFAYQILRSVMELGEELRVHLNNLVGLEVLYEKALYPELEYIFKHALTQEVAYESLLKQRRREIHSRIAQAIEELYTDKLEQHYEMLAHHWEQSGNLAKALNYLILAGEKSNKDNAVQNACEFFKKALEVTKALSITLDPETELRVRRGYASASRIIGDIDTALEESGKAVAISRQNGIIDQEMQETVELALTHYQSKVSWAEASHFYDTAIARAQELDNKVAESGILASKGLHMCSFGQRYKGYLTTVEAERMSLESNDLLAIVLARGYRGITERWLGRPGKSIELTEGIVEAVRSMFDLYLLPAAVFIRGMALVDAGRIDEAMHLFRYGIDVCEKFGIPLFLVRLYNCLGYCFSEIYHPKKASVWNLRSEEMARQLMERYPGRYLTGEILAQASVNIMENLFDQGDSDAAWERINSLTEESKSEDFDRERDRWEARMGILSAQILLNRNDLPIAEEIVRKYLDYAKREHLHKYHGRLLKLLGEIQFRRKEIDTALRNIHEAIEILKEVGNPRQLWQAYSSLASVYSVIGRGSEAGEQLGAAAEVIQKTANGLSERELREGFLSARPIREILARTIQHRNC